LLLPTAVVAKRLPKPDDGKHQCFSVAT